MNAGNIQVRYFAWLREALGEGEVLAVQPGASAASVRQMLQARSALHLQMLGPQQVLRCAVNQVLCAEDGVVPDGAEVAFFPPVTGG
jgi:sulfur-carrier protein